MGVGLDYELPHNRSRMISTVQYRLRSLPVVYANPPPVIYIYLLFRLLIYEREVYHNLKKKNVFPAVFFFLFFSDTKVGGKFLLW